MRGMQSFVLELELKSPIHVGMGAENNHPAYAYIPDLERGDVVLLDSPRLVAELDEDRRQLFLRAVAEGPTRAQRLLQGWHQEGVRLPEVGRIPASRAFLNATSRATDQAELEFRPLPRNLNGPYLPGSSVKGALRTAWLYYKLEPQVRHRDLVYDPHQGWILGPEKREGSLKPGRGGLRAAQALEAYALGYEGRKSPNMHKDPFRAVRLGDSPALATTRLDRIGVIHPQSKLNDMAILAEVIPEGSRLNIPFRYHEALAKEHVVSQEVDPIELQDAAYSFYSGVLQEDLIYAENNNWARAIEFYRSLEEQLADSSELFPIRFGFGSGKLANTLLFLMEEPSPKTRKSAGSSEPAMGLPLGWAVARLKKV